MEQAFRSHWTTVACCLRASLRSHLGLATLILFHAAAAFAVSAIIGRPFAMQFWEKLAYLLSAVLPVFLLFVAIREFVLMVLHEKPKSPLRHMVTAFSEKLSDLPRMIDGLIALVLIILFMASFAFIKEAIPHLNAFAWDRSFAEVDRAIFFGQDPWRVTFWVFGSAWGTKFLDVCYNLWYFLLFGALMTAAFMQSARHVRLSLLYAFVLLWAIGGNLLAVGLSSVGPVYYSRIGLGPDFDNQMFLLRSFSETVPIGALRVQDLLWASYLQGEGHIAGISAMPSMHVATSVLVAACGFRLDRRLGTALTVFAAIIAVGSVHLAWHYAVDGLLGAVVALLCWNLGSLLAKADLAMQRINVPKER